MKTERTCPECRHVFSAVADYCICPQCNHRFYASDPNRPNEVRMPAELSFRASTVGIHDEDGILNIGFQDSEENYLLLSRVADEFMQEFDDRGGVYVEVNSQMIASVDSFESIALSRGGLLVRFIHGDVMNGLLTVRIDFDEKLQLEELAEQFAVLMRGKEQYSCSIDDLLS